MKVIGLDGKSYVWKLEGKMPRANDRKNRSSYHLRARRLLRTEFPLLRIYEEVVCPHSGGLTADFVIIPLQMIIEVHGEQHYTQNDFFHKDRAAFLRGQKNDERKREWCDINGFRYIELPYNQSDAEWLATIRRPVETREDVG